MNIERIVAERLQQDGAGRAPDGLLASTLEMVSTMPQQRVLWPRGARAKAESRRRPGRPLFAIGATLVTIGLLGALAIAGGGNQPTREPLSTLAPTMPPATPSALQVAVGNLAAGRYYRDAQLESYWRWDSGTPRPDLMPFDSYDGVFMGAVARVTFDLPVGWSHDGDEIFREESTVDGLSLWVGVVDAVYSDPCGWMGGSTVDPLDLRSLEGLADALGNSWPTPTIRRPADIGGRSAQYIETRVPEGLDTATCDAGQYALYEPTRSGRNPADAGELVRLWVVDVDGATSDLLGGLLVVDARSRLEASEADLAELQAVVDSIVIDQLPLSAMARGGPAVPLPASGPLDPGNYFMANPYEDDDLSIRTCVQGCSAYGELVFNLPSGWATRDRYVHKNPGLISEVGFSAWTIGGVYADPCHWRDSAVAPLASFHSQEGDQFHLAADSPLLEQFGAREGSLATLGGISAVRLEQLVPATLDIAACDEGEYRTWTEWDVAGGGNSRHAAGQLDTIYIVDVDRRPLFIDVSRMPFATPEDVAELDQIIDTMLIW